ncbi:hypothetical protein, conserved [Angomonas deanei]|uniref:Uncharacterized protein n=1 Tax=Angomonas deanei TaxID=59799 RepID=A0A7G2C9U9_9TRYP|nr:hypothetical protein, conserved [Angomonas deanei]
MMRRTIVTYGVVAVAASISVRAADPVCETEGCNTECAQEGCAGEECLPKYYFDEATCKPCTDTACLQCALSGASDKCTQCEANFVLDAEAGTCKACADAVTGCTTCTEASAAGTESKCTTCNGTTHETQPNEEGACTPVSEDPKKCTDGEQNCSKCDEAGDKCTQCKANFVLDAEAGTCKACADAVTGCTTCTEASAAGTESKCTTCNGTTHETQPNEEGACTPVSEDPKKCTDGEQNCSKCDEAGDKCTQCKANFVLDAEACTCKACADAVTGCTTCTEASAAGTESKCTTCKKTPPKPNPTRRAPRQFPRTPRSVPTASRISKATKRATSAPSRGQLGWTRKRHLKAWRSGYGAPPARGVAAGTEPSAPRATEPPTRPSPTRRAPARQFPRTPRNVWKAKMDAPSVTKRQRSAPSATGPTT